jgi:hypothetical protein
MNSQYSQDVRRAKKMFWMGEDPDVAAKRTSDKYEKLGHVLSKLGCTEVVTTSTSVSYYPPRGMTTYQAMQKAEAIIKSQ